MTDEAKALVERLREDVFYGDARMLNMDKHNPLHMRAADLIETQAREIERLRKLIEATSAHFLRLNIDHPIMWEGAIDGAMEAVCQEVECQAAELAQLRFELEAANDVVAEQLEIRQRNEAELAKWKALAETLAGALKKSREGWANALELRLIPERHRNTAEVLAREADQALTSYKEQRDA